MSTLAVLILSILAGGAGYCFGRAHACFRVAKGLRP